MNEKSTYGLKPEQLERLLSIGSKGTKSESVASDKTKESPPTIQTQPQIEGYEILGKLGEAGQGQIWRALQLSTNRQVALKVPKTGLISSEKILARFEREIELAAALKNPNIARIHDSGIHQGIYYYAMDLVEGMHLDQYVKEYNLTFRQILKLMWTICQAVQHAHQKGVIHRDLKPSNIIVTKDGQPFIVDFGLAKNLLEDDPALTVSIDGEAAGTPAYMSPEQAAGHIDKLDTQTDVYSLGVILFTLLTDESPHDLSGSRYQVMRRIAEEQIRRPRKICPKIDKELELLLLKALDNKPDRRYAAAGMLAQDIDNYLNGAPLFAVPQSSVYQLKKFVRRNRTLVASVVSVLLVLVTGTVISTIFAIDAERARADAQATADFLTKDVLASVQEIKGREATMIDILNSASKSLEGRFDDQPLVEAEICWTLGRNYYFLHEHGAAIPYLERAYQIRREQLGEFAEPSLIAKDKLGFSLIHAGRLKEAERLFEKHIARIQQFDPENVYFSNISKCKLSVVYKAMGRYEEAERLMLETWENDDKWWEPKWHREAKIYQDQLADIYVCQSRYEEAEKLYIEILEKEYPVHGDNVYTWWSMDGWPRLYMAQGRYEEAENLLIKGIEIRRRELPGKDNPLSFIFINCLAVLRTKQERYPEAETLFKEVLEARNRKLGSEHPETLQTKNDLAVLYIEQARYKEAEKYLLKAVKGRRLKLGDTHPHTIESLNNLIDLYEAWNKPEQAEQWRAKLPKTEAKIE